LARGCALKDGSEGGRQQTCDSTTNHHQEIEMNTMTSVPDPVPVAGESREASANTLRGVVELAGRVLLAALFLITGLGKIGAFTATAGYMASLGVPGALLPAVIATEVLGAIALIVGWQTRVTSFLLAGFTLLAALIFHNNFADQVQMIMFLKNVSIAGGLLLLVANGPGPLSLDRRIAK
jgi:putative oxidoreductase